MFRLTNVEFECVGDDDEANVRAELVDTETFDTLNVLLLDGVRHMNREALEASDLLGFMATCGIMEFNGRQDLLNFWQLIWDLAR